MCFAIICFSGCDVLNFEINLVFLIKPFFCITKNLKQKLKYLENKKSFLDEMKTFCNAFKGPSVAKNCLRPKVVPLMLNDNK